MTGDDIRDDIGKAREPEPAEAENCPAVALGHLGGTYFFLSAAGEIRELKARDFTALGMVSLFDGDSTWLHQHFAKVDRLERPTGELDVNRAATMLMRFCRNAGLWRVNTPKRKIGVWREDEDVVAHCGDALYVYGARPKRRTMRAGQHLGGAIYLGAPPIEPPDATPATKEDAAECMTAIETLWRFAAPHLPRMVFGFLVVSMLGAAPRWRVHLLLKGKRGEAGKTALLRLIAAANGPQSQFVNDPTEAGLRELLTDEARTIVFDEAGAQGGEDRSVKIEAIIGLLRRMAGEEGARSLRGSGSGARQFTMAGSVALGAANAPILDAQDRSRILEVEMLPADPRNKGRVEAAERRFEELSPKLRARALKGWGRFSANLKIYHAALLGIGCDSRLADQMGTLFAGAEMMLSDEPAVSADPDLLAFGESIAAYVAEDEELSNATRCLGVLMSTQIEHWKGGGKSTIGRLVQFARGSGGVHDREALPNYGLRLEAGPDGRAELWVANTHQQLMKVFAGTDWRAGGWRDALKQLPEATASKGSVWFDGHKCRYVAVPPAFLPPLLPEDPRGPV